MIVIPNPPQNEATTLAFRDGASFRDSAGHVYRLNGRVLRTVTAHGTTDYEFVRDSDLLARWNFTGQVISSKEVEPSLIGAADVRFLLEHPELPFVSYPYEWSFSALRAAALLHLELILEGLESDLTLSDASAYNVQFLGCRPQFIDILSFSRYREGDYWIAHQQFCEQFLNPLLLTALRGVPFNAWLRGSLEGIPTEDLGRLLPWYQKLGWRVLSHVVLPSAFHMRARKRASELYSSSFRRPLPRSAYRAMVSGLHKWIESLSVPRRWSGQWLEYATDNTYSPAEAAVKEKFVTTFVNEVSPRLLLDFGCNTGRYAELALRAGARSVIGFDSDPATIEFAFREAMRKNLNFLPLYLDAANPSPGQGWQGLERKPLGERVNADGLLALAFVHHLTIGRNIPFGEVVGWLVSLAPEGVIEFVSKEDPTVRFMLRNRTDIFPEYSKESFYAILRQQAEVVSETEIGGGRRLLVRYRRSLGRDSAATASAFRP
jgi:ribosomal protein L11 methylase PrmA